MPPAETNFLKPTPLETFFNRALGLLVVIGLGPKDYYLLEVRGRKSGRLYSTPVSIVEHGEHWYVVAPRGTTQWVRNARSVGRITLRVGSKRDQFDLREVPAPDRALILKSYLARYTKFVQRYFQVQNGAPEAEFAAVADGYPVFELIPAKA
ncbi:MAG TPA: nitroreductase family deazaflavin-dependent oxidoreductase [Candidatus Binataceae bacterium]|nr:nitroreductase family deazaflavin-dependent oxidoreductase [Candidatus Binataceae bacterium]